jgi:4Fe-4S ferredoxin
MTIENKSSKFSPGFLFPVVDANRCEGKGPCIEVCPVSVFNMGILPKSRRSELSLKGKVKGFAHRWKQAIVINPQACEGCGLCVSACPEKAIMLVKSTVES